MYVCVCDGMMHLQSWTTFVGTPRAPIQCWLGVINCRWLLKLVHRMLLVTHPLTTDFNIERGGGVVVYCSGVPRVLSKIVWDFPQFFYNVCHYAPLTTGRGHYKEQAWWDADRISFLMRFRHNRRGRFTITSLNLLLNFIISHYCYNVSLSDF